MNHWVFDCKEVTRKVSDSMDRKLPLFQRIGIAIHLFMCKFCSLYREQMLILREALRFYVMHEEDREPPHKLPPDAQERIKRALTNK